MRGLRTAAFLLAAAAAGWVAPARGTEALRWGAIAVKGGAPGDSATVARALDLEGRRVEDAPLAAAIDRALAALAERGHPFAEIRPGAFDLSGGYLVGTLTVTPGTTPRLDGVTLEGARVTRPSTVLRVSGIRPGEIYTGDEDVTVRERIARSGLFTGVGEATLVPGNDSDAVRIKIPVSEPPYTRFRGVLGVSGKEAKVTGLLDLDLANIAGTGRHGTARWENRGDGLTRYALGYREPWLPLVPIGLSGNLAHDVNESAYSYTKWEVTGDLSLANQWSFQVGRGGTRAVETTRAGNTREGYFVAGVSLDRRNSAWNPTAGYRMSVESRRGKKTYTPLGDSLEVRIDRTRWDVAAEGYRRFGRQWLAFLGGNFHYLDTPEDSIPRWDQIAVGGATSLRGYREEQFLTRAAWIIQAEWRWLQDDRGSALYLFNDVGFIAEGSGRRLRDTFDRFLMGTGVGVRQASKLGILGVEYGVAKGDSPLDGRIHLRIDAVF